MREWSCATSGRGIFLDLFGVTFDTDLKGKDPMILLQEPHEHDIVANLLLSILVNRNCFINSAIDRGW